MKGKRSKQYRKLMHSYALTFALREPYQTLLTAAFIRDAARYKMHLGSLLTNTLHGEIKPMITQCSIRHLYTAEPPPPEQGGQAAKEAWIDVAKTCERRRCGHHELDEPLSELECLGSVVDPKNAGRNRFGYVVAAQEKEIRARMREVAGVPLVYINRSVMILEPMAQRSGEVREAEERGKVRAGLKTRRSAAATVTMGGEKRKREDGEVAEEDEGEAAVPKRKKAKGPKAPNPLSVKKAKKPAAPAPPVGKEFEDERAVLRKAAKRDPQASEKAVGAELAVGGSGDVDGERKKRKRKRKPKDGEEVEGGDDEGASA